MLLQRAILPHCAPFGVEIDDAEITSDQKNFGKCAHTQ